MLKPTETPIYRGMYDLLLYLHERVKAYPKTEKYTIGKEIKKASTKTLLYIYKALYTLSLIHI